LSEIHKQSIIHRDLKPANILRHNGDYLIADMGVSRLMPETGLMSTYIGTPAFIAPEILLRNLYSSKVFFFFTY